MEVVLVMSSPKMNLRPISGAFDAGHDTPRGDAQDTATGIESRMRMRHGGIRKFDKNPCQVNRYCNAVFRSV